MPTVTFFYDLGSPYAYITADRIDEQFDTNITVDWVPVLLGGIFKANGRSSWAETPLRADGMAEIAQRASAYGMPAFHYPEPWPNNGLAAMRVAAWAHSAGAGRRFARAGFEVQFNDGLALSEQDNIELAAHRAGLDPQFAIEAAQDQVVKQALIDNTQAAIDIGAIGVPTVVVGDQVFWGDDKLHEAVAAAAEL
ncbi:MAG: 2-hydroxychromene-2-carboxylate isomerase [Solirubrobacterales bacterium]